MVKEGTSFAFAAGARSKPAAAASGAENGGGEDGGRKGRGSSHAEKRAGSQGKKRGDGEGGKKGHKRGQAGNKGGAKGWGAAPSKPLIASSASFVPASAVKAAPFVPLSKQNSGGAMELAAAAAKLSVKAPAFTPRAAAPEFVPKSKD